MIVIKRRISKCLTIILGICAFCLFSLLLIQPPTESKTLPYDFSILNKTFTIKTTYNPLEPPEDKLNNSRYDDILNWKYLFKIPDDLQDIVQSIQYLNYNHEIRNEDKFGSLNINNTKIVIVIQVHERLEYLKYLISTLRDSTGIEETLIIFSHDMNHNEINEEIKKIDFCRVIQIFFPYNIQIFANIFPGSDPNDCSPNVTFKNIKSTDCINYKNHDTYGHYRIPGISQIKHHWWWKMNYVFDGIIRRYNLLNSYAVLLEEDHYVSPDFIYVLNKLISTKNILCPKCKVLSLGGYSKNFKYYQRDTDKLGINIWFSSKHNMGMAINIETWDEIHNCSRFFCGYDDYNWDWSLLQVSLKCVKQKFQVLFVKSPRVIHIGDCGVHTHRCHVQKAVENARELFSKHNESLFPINMTVSEISSRMLKPSKPNGGWGDIRDQELCLTNSYSMSNFDKIVIKDDLPVVFGKHTKELFDDNF